MKTLFLILKGMIIGLANIIPGVSGGTLMITLGIYEQVIDTINNFFKNFKKNLKFIIPLGIGIISSVLLFSKLISLALEKFPFATTLTFLGLILGGFPFLIKNLKKRSDNNSSFLNYFIAFLAFTFVLIFAILKKQESVVDLTTLNIQNSILLFIVGIIASSTMVIPGISGSFVLMFLGYYKPLIDSIHSLTSLTDISHNLIILVIFIAGVLIGIMAISKLIEFLLKKYETKTYFAVLGFVSASIISIIKPLFLLHLNILEVLIGLIGLAIGFLVAYKISNK